MKTASPVAIPIPAALEAVEGSWRGTRFQFGDGVWEKGKRGGVHILQTEGFHSGHKILVILHWFPEDELATEPLKYAEQLPVAQIIHQKPKQKDWHPPGGFILGLWALIIMVFFKTYGIKHMKHVF